MAEETTEDNKEKVLNKDTEKPAEEEDSDPDHLVTPPPKTGGSKAVLIIVIVLVIVIALGGGGFLAWKYLLKDKFTNKDSSSGATTASDTASTPASTATTPPTSATSNSSDTATTASTSASKTAITDEYIIADSSTRSISRAELTSLTPWQLKVARNEIYARHGREFVHKDLQCYFATKAWYKVTPAFTETDLSVTENQNIATVQDYEKEISSSLASDDSGC